MENKSLPVSLSQQDSGLTISEGFKPILKVIGDINSLVGFPLDYGTLEAWSKDIDRLATPEEKEKLPFLMDCFKTGKLFYDKTEGIQNIFKSLERVKKVGDKFEILKPIW